MKILTISRAAKYSPNMQNADALILSEVVSLLVADNHDVVQLKEDDLLCLGDNSVNVSLVDVICQRIKEYNPDVIVSMARNTYVLDALDMARNQINEGSESKITIINDPVAVKNSSRSACVEILEKNNIPVPQSLVLSVSGNGVDYAKVFSSWKIYPCWIKRGDACAQEEGDVAFVASSLDSDAVLRHFEGKGISDVVVSEHLKGDLVKFYSVVGTDFFYWYYADLNHGKFGLEKHNTPHRGFAFSEERLKEIADKAASSVGLSVFGGDCIVGGSGEFRIIDFNDWPSFSPCRAKAASAIVECLYETIEQI